MCSEYQAKTLWGCAATGSFVRAPRGARPLEHSAAQQCLRTSAAATLVSEVHADLSGADPGRRQRIRTGMTAQTCSGACKGERCSFHTRPRRR